MRYGCICYAHHLNNNAGKMVTASALASGIENDAISTTKNGNVWHETFAMNCINDFSSGSVSGTGVRARQKTKERDRESTKCERESSALVSMLMLMKSHLHRHNCNLKRRSLTGKWPSALHLFRSVRNDGETCSHRFKRATKCSAFGACDFYKWLNLIVCKNHVRDNSQTSRRK